MHEHSLTHKITNMPQHPYQGVMLKFRVKRGLQVFELPILLSPDPNMQLAALALAAPTVMVLATKVLLYDPIVNHMRRRTASQVAKQRSAELWQARKEALVAQVCMYIICYNTLYLV